MGKKTIAEASSKKNVTVKITCDFFLLLFANFQVNWIVATFCASFTLPPPLLIYLKTFSSFFLDEGGGLESNLAN